MIKIVFSLSDITKCHPEKIFLGEIAEKLKTQVGMEKNYFLWNFHLMYHNTKMIAQYRQKLANCKGLYLDAVTIKTKTGKVTKFKTQKSEKLFISASVLKYSWKSCTNHCPG